MPDSGALIEQAEALFRKGQFQASNELLQGYCAAVRPTSFVATCIGRNHRYAGDLDSAKHWLEQATGLRPVFAWAWFELAALATRAGDKRAAAAATESFLDAGSGPIEQRGYNPTHCGTMLASAHGCYEVDRAAARRLYAKLGELGIEDYLLVLRLLEAHLEAGRVDAARAGAERLKAAYTLDAWGYFAVSRVAQIDGRAEESAAALEQAVQLAPTDTGMRAAACHRLIELGHLDRAAAETARFVADAALPAEERQRHARNLQLRLDARTGAADAALARLDAGEATLAGTEDWILAEVLFELLPHGTQPGPATLALSDRIAAHLEAKVGASVPACQASLHYCVLTRQWARAEALLASIEATPLFAQPELVLRRFEIACAMRRLDQAGAIYAEAWKGRALTVSESALAMRYLGEIREWGEAADIAQAMLARQMVLPKGEYSLLQLARRAGRQREFLATLSGGEGGTATWRDFADRLRRMLVDDLCVQGGVGSVRLEEAGEPLPISPGNAVLVKEADAAAAPGARRFAAFLCTDRSYFFSALTMLASCALNMDRQARPVEWFLFVGADVPPAWRHLAAAFGGRIGLPLTVLEESKFVPSTLGCLAEYGLFTGGNVLARAAYYRVYAARYLYRLGRFSRAVYLDTDIICQGDLSRLFDLDLGGRLLAARCEEPSPEVELAARNCEVEAGSYFNSGVLLLDFALPGTLVCLDRSIAMAEHEPQRLTYHDQCALNIGFARRAVPLPAEFNHFLRPHRADNGDLGSAVLLHFLDRPKPWDVGFERAYRSCWTRYAAVVRLLLAPEEYGELVAAANGRTAGPPIDAEAAELAGAPVADAASVAA